MAQRYSAISDWTASNPRIPIAGSTSTWVRIRVAPLRMHSTRVRSARARTSSAVKPDFKAATCRIGLISRPASGGQRLVEMNVRLDQAGTGKAPSRVVGFGCTRQPALNRDDLACGNAAILRLRKRAVGKAGIA